MIYAIGDVHGKAAMLSAALMEINSRIKPEDTVVFLGDYIDRGEDSMTVIDMVLDFKQHHTNTVCLRGNHEQMLLDSGNGEGSLHLWYSNGGESTLDSYGTRLTPKEGRWEDAIPKEHYTFFKETLLDWESDSYYFVHAGLTPPSQRREFSPRKGPIAFAESRLWIREGFVDSEEDFGKTVVFGHTIQRDRTPLVMHNKIGIDTGAFTSDGRLTVAVLYDDVEIGFKFFQVNQNFTITNVE